MTKHILPNGLTVLLSPINHVRSISIGIFVNSGSTQEPEEQAGLAHFLEHMLFKGTKTRTAKEIVSAIEGKGGMLNAYTAHEQTCYYVRVIDTEYKTALDILSDIYINSTFEDNELLNEKKVVLEEIARAEDDPEGYIHDMFLSQRLKNSPYGREILGTKSSVNNINRQMLQQYVQSYYTAQNTILSIAGNFNTEDILDYISECFADLSTNTPNLTLQNDLTHYYDNIVVEQDVEQAYFCMGFTGVSASHPLRHAGTVLDTAFGGEMYSRLFQEIREKRGLAYAISSYLGEFKAGGLLMAYGGINANHWNEVHDIILKEMNDIQKNGLTDEEFQMAKNTVIGHAVLKDESPMAIMNKQAQNEVLFGCDITLTQYIDSINDVQHNDIIEFARISSGKYSSALIKPKSGILSKLRLKK